jgi:hypothetical protein
MSINDDRLGGRWYTREQIFTGGTTMIAARTLEATRPKGKPKTNRRGNRRKRRRLLLGGGRWYTHEELMMRETIMPAERTERILDAWRRAARQRGLRRRYWRRLALRGALAVGLLGLAMLLLPGIPWWASLIGANAAAVMAVTME